MVSEETFGQPAFVDPPFDRGYSTLEKLGQNFLANVDKHSQNVDAVNRGRPKGPHGFKGKSQSRSHSRDNGRAKGDSKRKGSCRNWGTSHPP